MNASRSFVATALLLLVGCTTHQDLAVPAPSQVEVDPKGNAVRLGLHRGHLDGELIGVSGEHYLLLDEEYMLLEVDTTAVMEARVIISRTSEDPRKYAWSSALPFLCLAHGYFGALSLPVNLIAVISVNAGSAGSRNVVQVDGPVGTWELLPFARFPQGIPAAYLQRHPVAPPEVK